MSSSKPSQTITKNISIYALDDYENEDVSLRNDGEEEDDSSLLIEQIPISIETSEVDYQSLIQVETFKNKTTCLRNNNNLEKMMSNEIDFFDNELEISESV